MEGASEVFVGTLHPVAERDEEMTVRAASRHAFWAVRIFLDPEVEEIISYVLWRAGTTGIHKIEDQAGSASDRSGDVQLAAYFREMQSAAWWERECRAALALAEVDPSAVKSIVVEPVLEQDWLAAWKESYTSFTVGRRFVIAPSWDVPENVGDRILIILDPGMAFGTGTHETTKQCLRAIEEYWSGDSLLDVGTGTGILALAAAKLAPGARITAIDIDPEACRVASENFSSNGVAGQIRVLEGTVDQVRSESFGAVVANLTTEAHLGLIESFSRLVEDHGILILSGILQDDEPMICQALTRSKLKTVEIKRDGEWLTFIARRAS